MIFAVLICISLIILGVCWFFYRRNIELFLCILIALNFELFYLAPRIQGPDDYKLLLLPIMFILLADGFFRDTLSMGRYGWWIIAYLGISALTVVLASFYGQSLELGIKAAKFAPFMLVYFVIAGRQIDVDKFARYFIFMALGIAAFATLQYFMSPKAVIFPSMPEPMRMARLENPRITIGQFVISAAAVMSFAQYTRRSNVIFLLVSGILFLEVLFIQHTRAFIAGVLVSTVIIYLLSHKLTTLRVSAYLIIAGVFLSSLLVVGADIYDVGLIKRTGTDIAKKTGSFQGRINAYNYYWKEIEKRPILGRGLWNFNWQGNNERYLQQEKGIHLSDIGITHFFVQAGFIGFFWFLYGLYRIWRDMFRYQQYICLTSYFVLATFTMLTIDMYLRVDSVFLFAVFLGMFATTIFAETHSTATKKA